EIMHAPPTVEVAHQRLDALIEHLRGRANDRAPDLVRALMASPDAYRQPPIGGDQIAPLLMSQLGSLVADQLKQDIGRAYYEMPGIADGDRQEQLDQLDQLLLEAELSEE